MAVIAVRHNIEMAHRLYINKGKCENIHGHSMWVTMYLEGKIDSTGYLAGVEFGDLKRVFRHHLDTTYDHHLVLNLSDPFARPIYVVEDPKEGLQGSVQTFLPGLQAVPGDPTTENMARWILEWAVKEEIPAFKVEVWETSVNMATALEEDL